MADSSRITIACPCGAVLGVPASAVGKKTKCPRCGQVLTIAAPHSAARPIEPAAVTPPRSDTSRARSQKPAVKPPPARPAAPPPMALPVEDADPGYSVAFNELAEDAAAPLPPPAAACPQCSAAMPAGAVLCVACGYDSRSGRKLKAKKGRKPSAVGQAAVRTGQFILGVVLSGAGAVLGAFIWCLVIAFTGYEVGWIAWGVGGLAGFGMYLGYQHQDGLAGLVAAIIALSGIMAAKGVIFFLIQAMLKEAGEPGIRFGELFGVLDVVFFFLAGATAFRIASGGSSD